MAKRTDNRPLPQPPQPPARKLNPSDLNKIISRYNSLFTNAHNSTYYSTFDKIYNDIVIRRIDNSSKQQLKDVYKKMAESLKIARQFLYKNDYSLKFFGLVLLQSAQGCGLGLIVGLANMLVGNGFLIGAFRKKIDAGNLEEHLNGSTDDLKKIDDELFNMISGKSEMSETPSP